MQKIYICSRCTDDARQDLEQEQLYCRYTAGQNALPVSPKRYFSFWTVEEHAHPWCREAGLSLLHSCDALWYFGDQISRAMIDDILEARKRGIPVRYVSAREMEN